MAIDNYIDRITKDGESRMISPAADKVRVENEHYEGDNLDDVLDEIDEKVSQAGTGNYTKPSTGIPKSDMESAVQTSLGKADSAVQDIQINGGLILPKVHNNVDIFVPTKTSQLQNDSGFITSDQVPSGETDPAMSSTSERPVQNKVIKAYVDSLIQGLIDGAPAALDTLKKLATALGNNSDAYATLINLISSKANASEVYTKSQVEAMVADAGNVKSVTINGQKKNPNQQTGDIDLGSVPTTAYIDNAVSQMEAQIEQEQLNVITGGTLSLWLDEDGESINIIAGDIPDIAAAPTITKQTNNDGTVTVSIASTEQGATIYYTIDGTTPTAESTQYNNSALTFNTAGTTTIKAIAVVEGKIPSVATETVEVVSCTTPVITVDNTSNTQCTVTATAGSGESVSLTVGEQTATGTGSASVTIAKTNSTQTLSATATATATGKLTATASQNVTVEEKVAYTWADTEIGGIAADASVPITVTAQGSSSATFEEVDGVVYWKADLNGKIPNISSHVNELYNFASSNSSIFTAGIANVLTIEHIPNIVETFGVAMLKGCTSLKKIKVQNQSNLKSLNGSIKEVASSIEEVILPSSVTSAGTSCCANCTKLKSFTAPGLKSIPQSMFEMSSTTNALENVILGQLTYVGQTAFKNCTKLSFDNFDFTKVTTIAKWAFVYCYKLKTIALESITSIGNKPFEAISMTSITINKEIASSGEAPTVQSDSFTAANSTFPIYVPASSVSYYQAAWASVSSRIQAIPSNS